MVELLARIGAALAQTILLPRHPEDQITPDAPSPHIEPPIRVDTTPGTEPQPKPLNPVTRDRLNALFDSGAASDDFYLNAPPAIIEGYDPALEYLLVLYDSLCLTPTLTTEDTNDGASLLADGQVIAYLPGIRGFDLDTVEWMAF